MKKIIWLIIMNWLMTSCHHYEADNPDTATSSHVDTIPNFFDKNVVLATGIDFLTGEPVVLNPITGEVLNPLTDSQNNNCNFDEIIIYSNQDSGQALKQQLKPGKYPKNTKADKQKSNNCNANIVNPNEELASAIKNSKQIINGTIRLNGKDIPARFVVSVTALFEGSNCAYFISGGKQYLFCSDTTTNCNLLLPKDPPSYYPGYAFSSNESYRRAVRKVCRNFPDWKKSDCSFLKLRYKAFKEASGHEYSLKYKQYTWKTCNKLDTSSWGTCPPPVSQDPSISECVKPIITP